MNRLQKTLKTIPGRSYWALRRIYITLLSSKLPHCWATARIHGMTVAAGVNQQDLPFWIEQRVDLVFCTNDIAAMKEGAQATISEAQNLIEKLEGVIRK